MNKGVEYMHYGPLRRAGSLIGTLALCLAPLSAHASLFEGETLDAVANGASWLVLVVGPIVGIAVFWIVHILPEKIAEKKHHPQAKAIQTLCLLSLFFGGLLWPLAWLWAMTKPVMHQMAYGTDKEHHGEAEPQESELPAVSQPPHQEDELRYLREQIDRFTASTPPTPEQLEDLRRRLAVIEAAAAIPRAATKG